MRTTKDCVVFSLLIGLFTHVALGQHPFVVSSPRRIVTEFAVPVAVPVAPFSPVWYGTSPAQFGGTTYGPATDRGPNFSARDSEAWLDQIAEKVAARLSNDAKRQPAPSVGSTLFQERCTICHGGTSPKGKVSFDNLESLSSELRLRAIRSILNGKMPQGGAKVSPEEVGRLIGELAGGEGKTKTEE